MISTVPVCRGVSWRAVNRLIDAAEAPIRPILQEFAEWLHVVRGLVPGSIALRIGSIRRFLSSIVAEQAVCDALGKLTPATLDDFFREFGVEFRYTAQRNTRAAVRLFLRFSADRGWTAPSLTDMVPRVRTRKCADVPRGLTDAQIAALLNSVNGSSPSDIRDRAILVLLAVYGVRRGQVAALRLSDLDWKKRMIRVPAHKGGKPIVHTLHSAVGAALAHYIRVVRPAGVDPAVFFRLTPKPVLPLRPNAITTMVRGRLLAAGIETTKKGPHLFRHSFATRLLRAGRSLKEIADLLGQRHLDSASIYAKVDGRRLIDAALEWPEVLR